MKKYLLISLILFFACNPKEKSSAQETPESLILEIPGNITSINWDSVEIQKLPYQLKTDQKILDHMENIDAVFNYFAEKRSHEELNSLFVKSTVINTGIRPYEGIILPNDVEGVFFKRFPDINNHKVLLFCCLPEPDPIRTHPSFEIQLFDEENTCVDRMIVADGKSGEDCYWNRSFSYSLNNIITMSDIKECYGFDDLTSTHYNYQIKPNGKIVEYFDAAIEEFNEPSGLTYPIMKDTVDEDGLDIKVEIGNEEFYTKGTIKNHYKDGIWEEYNVYEEQLNYCKEKLFPFAKGQYKEGEKVGQWIYYIENPQHFGEFMEYETVDY